MTPRRASDQAPRAWPNRGDALTSAEWVADTYALHERPEYRAELPQRWTRPVRQVVPGPWGQRAVERHRAAGLEAWLLGWGPFVAIGLWLAALGWWIVKLWLVGPPVILGGPR